MRIRYDRNPATGEANYVKQRNDTSQQQKGKTDTMGSRVDLRKYRGTETLKKWSKPLTGVPRVQCCKRLNAARTLQKRDDRGRKAISKLDVLNLRSRNYI